MLSARRRGGDGVLDDCAPQGERAVGYGLRKDVGRTGLLFTRVDAIIGSGWLFGALYVSQIVGPAAIVSLAVAGLMVMVIGLVYAELAVMFPVSGGIIRFPHYALGSLASYSSGWTSWLAAAVVPIEVLATTQYADPYIPWLMDAEDGLFVLTRPGLAVAIGLIFLYSLVNALGVRLLARLNNVLVWWKPTVIVLVIVGTGRVGVPSRQSDRGRWVRPDRFRGGVLGDPGGGCRVRLSGVPQRGRVRG